MRYKGGVGGITIPINKAIDKMDRSRKADITVMGHFHTLTFGDRFIINGSMIGFGVYSDVISAAFERPQQAFFIIDSKHGLTVRAPILLEA